MSHEFPEFSQEYGVETFAAASCSLGIRIRLRNSLLLKRLAQIEPLFPAEPSPLPGPCTGRRGRQCQGHFVPNSAHNDPALARPPCANTGQVASELSARRGFVSNALHVGRPGSAAAEFET